MTTLTFNDQELQELVAMVDAALRHQGIRAAKPAAALLDKVEAAQEAERKIEGEKS